MKKLLTLCMVIKDNNILLGMKKRGFGAGHWNGFGGKVEENETIEDAAKRELREEAGLEVIDMHKAGIIEFLFENDPKILEVHIFIVTNFTGVPVESDEMVPKWFEYEHIPYDQMWADDKYWLPLVLDNKLVKGKFLFDKPSSAEYIAKIMSEQLEIVSKI